MRQPAGVVLADAPSSKRHDTSGGAAEDNRKAIAVIALDICCESSRIGIPVNEPYLGRDKLLHILEDGFGMEWEKSGLRKENYLPSKQIRNPRPGTQCPTSRYSRPSYGVFGVSITQSRSCLLSCDVSREI